MLGGSYSIYIHTLFFFLDGVAPAVHGASLKSPCFILRTLEPLLFIPFTVNGSKAYKYPPTPQFACPTLLTPPALEHAFLLAMRSSEISPSTYI
jgi:hypothetical protein